MAADVTGRRIHVGLMLWVLAAVISGCGRAQNPEEGVKSLEQTFANPATVPAIELAIAAVKTNDLGQGVVALQTAKQIPGLSPEQLQTVEETAQALTQELLRRADAGDARAKADLELIERSRSQ
ncbi:MAG: hypothetical protein J0M24_02440 [Verrucomicrobia bacterium]|nr:hypothetical protein [Verrucomicrobiota bacterium]